MKIKILGTGCYNCIHLETLISEVLKELGRTDVEILRVSDEKEIRKYIPLDLVPGLVINDRLVTSKDLPERNTLYTWLGEA